MNALSTSDQTNHRFAEAVRAYAPTVPRKWQKLLTLKSGIAELRRRGAESVEEVIARSEDVAFTLPRELIQLKMSSAPRQDAESSTYAPAK